MMSKQPNILFITTDEQHYQTLGVYGNSVVHTPNLDGLAADGIVFDRAYCANPLCSPSRSSMLTGQYPSHHGCWTVGVKLPKDTPSVAKILGDNGYKTALLGKAHFQPWDVIQGQTSEEATTYVKCEHDYSSWAGPYYGFQKVKFSAGLTVGRCENNYHYGKWLEDNGVDVKKYFDDIKPSMRHEADWNDTLWELPLEYHHSVWTADVTIDYLQQAANQDKPFFAWASFHDPHDPYRVPNPYHDRYRPEDVLPLIRREGEMDDKPPHYRQFYDGSDYSWLGDKEGDFNSVPAGYEFYKAAKDFPEWKHRLWNACIYGMVDLLDDQVGRILSSLESLGLAENTLVVFTTDHGNYMGNHNFWFKGPFHYEDVIRIPLIMRWPAQIKPARRSDSLISLIDLAPTFLGAAGVDQAGEMDGQNALRLLQGETEKLREYCIVENRATRTTLYAKTVVERRYKATFYEGKEYGELFDLKKDPNEFENLWDCPNNDNIKEKMFNELCKEQGDESRQPIPPRIGYA